MPSGRVDIVHLAMTMESDDAVTNARVIDRYIDGVGCLLDMQNMSRGCHDACVIFAHMHDVEGLRLAYSRPRIANVPVLGRLCDIRSGNPGIFRQLDSDFLP